MNTEKILVTGAAGFIGYHVARRLAEQGRPVVGIDNFNAYYDPALKHARLAELAIFPAFRFEQLDLADRASTAALFTANHFTHVIHLAAQPGVRHSLVDPYAYLDANLAGFLNVLEGCRHSGCRHLLYASSSAVYGGNTKTPFRTGDPADHPLSLYGATKKANEGMAHAYAHLFGLPTTGLRLFTVYGPWGRPDMAVWMFTEAIIEGRPIRLFNQGEMRRDFTFIDDVVEAIVRLIDHPPAGDPTRPDQQPDPSASRAPWRIYNIGNNATVSVTYMVTALESAIGRTAIREFQPMQPGDMLETSADTADLKEATGFHPNTPLEEGLQRFVEWYKGHRNKIPLTAIPR